MRKIIFILAFVLISSVSFGQMTFWNMTSTKGFKIATEYTGFGEKHLNYVYVEGVKGYGTEPNSSYLQLFREQAIVGGLSAHVEYRSNLNFDWQTTYVGFAYTFNFLDGYLALEPLYRLDDWKNSGFQFSVVGGNNWSFLEFAYFNDFYITNLGPGNYTEIRGWFEIRRINEWIKPGIVVSNTMMPGSLWNPVVFLGIKLYI